MKCNVCGEEFDPGNLSEVFKHEHNDNLDPESVKGIRGVEVKSSNDWWHDHELFPIMRIQDPDGWDRSDLHNSFYEETVSKEEFERRLGLSTCVPRQKAAK